jgi:urease accessory protein
MRQSSLSIISLPVLAALAPTTLWAHESGHAAGFAAGLAHPVGGADHLLAMIAVGLWAATLGGRALWALPGAFVVAMLAGGGAGFEGLPLPGVEPMILASVVLLGAAAALALRLSTVWAAAGVAVFALFHGHAHGAEAGASGFGTYALGFALATMGLHLVGLALGFVLNSGPARHLLRVLGAGTALAGLSLAFG